MSEVRRAAVVSISSGDHRAEFLRRRDALVETHLDLARSIARGVAAGLPRSFELDDLTQVAFIGLIKAATNYRPAEHADTPFSAYARPVIRGAILDSVRRGAYVENTRTSITEIPERAVEVDREAELDQARVSVEMRAAVSQLDGRQRKVVDLHYTEELRLPEVGRRLGVGKSRASQIHCEAVRALRVALRPAS